MAETRFILVVEDDPVLKNLLGHTFAGKYQTLYASDGNEALSLFEAHKPSLVLLDLMLPSMDGFAVLEAIRKRSDAAKDTPVIVVSNLGADKDKERATALGANDYLVKAEVSVEEITAKMEQMLGAAQIAAGESMVPPPVAEAAPAPEAPAA